MAMQKRLKGIILAVAMSFAAYGAYAENVSVSTYYPSQYGSYTYLTATRLDTTGETRLATDNVSGVCIGGTMPGACAAGSAYALGVKRDAFFSQDVEVSQSVTVGQNLILTDGGGNQGPLQFKCFEKIPGDGVKCWVTYA